MSPEFVCNIWKVEHGSAGFVQTPNNKLVLFDAGRSDNFSPALHMHQSRGIKGVDILVISHPHKDHIRDLPNVFSFLRPRLRIKNPYTPERLVYQNGKRNIQEPVITWKKMEDEYTGSVSESERFDNPNYFGNVQFNTYFAQEAQLPPGARENLNNYSLLTTMKYRGLTIIFPGDLEPDGWETILDNTTLADNLGGTVRILLASHHGRRSGIRYSDGRRYSRFLDRFKPHLTIISDRRGNESTDPEAYRPYCKGLNVEKRGVVELKKVLTTKTNECVSIQIINNDLHVKLY
jgi:beta-lactamase superfamily II metal-dependent hydrolase